MDSPATHASSAALVALSVVEATTRALLLLHFGYRSFKVMKPATPPPPPTPPMSPPSQKPAADAAAAEPAVDAMAHVRDPVDSDDAEEEKCMDSSEDDEGSTLDDETATRYRDDETVSPERCQAQDAEDEEEELKTVRFAEGNLESRYEPDAEPELADDKKEELLRDWIVIASLLWVSGLGASVPTRVLWTALVAGVAGANAAKLLTLYEVFIVPVMETSEQLLGAVLRRIAAGVVRAVTHLYVGLVRVVSGGLTSRELNRVGESVDGCLADIKARARQAETADFRATSQMALRSPVRSRAGRIRGGGANKERKSSVF
jgi:hypothetical protein